MAKQKGTNIVALRKLFREKGEAMEKQFLECLTPEQERLYRTAIATTMTPVEKQTELYVMAAQTLYARQADPLYELGLELANRSYTGIYRLFLKIPKPSYVISKAAAIWGTYYDQGHGDLENIKKNGVDFILKDIPDLPQPALHYIAGHAVKLLQLAGARNVAVDIDSSQSTCWRWKLNWE